MLRQTISTLILLLFENGVQEDKSTRLSEILAGKSEQPVEDLLPLSGLNFSFVELLPLLYSLSVHLIFQSLFELFFLFRK